MLENFKNLKIVKKLKNDLSPKWLKFSNTSRSSKDYIQIISGVDLKSTEVERTLEAMVRDQLKTEFPNIESMKSYELLVDAVVHNLKKKDLQ